MMSTHELESKTRELMELRRMQEELTAEIETLTDAIKAHMGEQETVTAGAYRITWKPVTTARFDSKALKAADPATYERFTISTTTRRFCLN